MFGDETKLPEAKAKAMQNVVRRGKLWKATGKAISLQGIMSEHGQALTGDEVAEAKLMTPLEEDSWIWLSNNKELNVTLGLTCVDTLDKHQFSESDFMDLDLEDIRKLRKASLILVLLLNTNLTVFIELASKQDMVAWLQLHVVNTAQ